MKIFLRLLAFTFVLFFSFCRTPDRDATIKVMTFNIRFDNPGDGVNAWPNRIPVVERYMNEEMPDNVGMQENLHLQNIDLLRIMPGYAYAGSDRDDGKQGGEFSPNAFRDDIDPRVIDYIFVDDPFEVLSYGVDRVKEGEVFISDHWPVKAVLRISF